MPKDKTGRAAQRQHRIGTHRSAHPSAPEGGLQTVLEIDRAAGWQELVDLILSTYPPQELIGMVKNAGAGRVERLERRQLRAYHPRAAELMMHLVNEGFCSARLLANGCMLYPLDGSDAYKVDARKGDRVWHQLAQWAGPHTAGIGHPLGVSPEQMAEKMSSLAEKVNDPVEHPVPKPPPPQPAAEPEPEPEWEPYTNREGVELPNWETDGKYIRCITCLDEGTDWHTTEPASLGGHTRSVHNREGLDTPEARTKATETRRVNRITAQVEQAIEFLEHSIGRTSTSDEYVTELEAEVDTLTEQLATITAERDECKAKLQLLREAMGA